MFSDVPASHPQAAYIEQLFRDGLTNGCATNPRRYCPEEILTRAQMATFLVRAYEHVSANDLTNTVTLTGTVSTEEEKQRAGQLASSRFATFERTVEQYRILRFGQFGLVIDQRSDIAVTNTDPARVILNFGIDDAKATVAQLEQRGDLVGQLTSPSGATMSTPSDSIETSRSSLAAL